MMANFVDPGEFVRAHETLAESAIARAADRASPGRSAYRLDAALVYPEPASRDS